MVVHWLSRFSSRRLQSAFLELVYKSKFDRAAFQNHLDGSIIVVWLLNDLIIQITQWLPGKGERYNYGLESLFFEKAIFLKSENLHIQKVLKSCRLLSSTGFQISTKCELKSTLQNITLISQQLAELLIVRVCLSTCTLLTSNSWRTLARQCSSAPFLSCTYQIKSSKVKNWLHWFFTPYWMVELSAWATVFLTKCFEQLKDSNCNAINTTIPCPNPPMPANGWLRNQLMNWISCVKPRKTKHAVMWAARSRIFF